MNRKNSSIITIVILCLVAVFCIQCNADKPARLIDRHALVTRHNIEWNDLDGQIPLGNGEFCFNVDGTGLQTFGGNTMAHWAWHSFPLPEGVTKDQIPSTGTFQNGRNTGPDIFPEGTSAIRQYMFDNPHSFNLGRIRLVKSDGQSVATEQIQNLSRTMDLWTGIQTSSFSVEGKPVQVETCVDPSADMVSIRIESPLFENGELGIAIDFPYPAIQRNKPWVGNFKRTEGNSTIRMNDQRSDKRADFRREIDDVVYYTTLNWSDGGILKAPVESEPNTWRLEANSVSSMQFTCAFSSNPLKKSLPGVQETEQANKEHWPAFWEKGGVIDLSESKDERWEELERRIVLSQYLTAVQSAGSYPPAEVGLMGIDSWRGQFHMEMIWWHLAHYALWDRWEMADSALTIYERFIPTARELAQQLGYKGFQWQKSASPGGRTAPWEGNQVLIWKQPHPIFFAELDYRLHPTNETLEKWAEIIEGTAEYMADYPVRDQQTGIFHLDPVMPPSEQGVTKDDIFDLAYWKWGLQQAQLWRERMGAERNSHWDEVIQNLAELPVKDGLYLHSPEWEDTYTERNWEHPNTVGVLGMLPPQKDMDFDTAHRSLLKVWETWQWKRCWGWDFPWTAMAAARLGEPKMAVDALLLDAGTKNHYDERGVCTGGPCPYLPGNGGLLYAVAMMAAGWDGAPDRNAPGFPDDGSWVVKWEGLKPAP
ncbi:hypothetical protein BC643_1229 [Mangrovibacterium diazotrophicum]|uniref:Glycosyl hydrolase family 65 n=1 Tax=Mangrovibacterium diazotrophicum TaxID=1261403 RepID=A0A419W614_9BACT|nr:hypothetical protein BC643_1229 [Mangrovibacterium diazotrophicum]